MSIILQTTINILAIHLQYQCCETSWTIGFHQQRMIVKNWFFFFFFYIDSTNSRDHKDFLNEIFGKLSQNNQCKCVYCKESWSIRNWWPGMVTFVSLWLSSFGNGHKNVFVTFVHVAKLAAVFWLWFTPNRFIHDRFVDDKEWYF